MVRDPHAKADKLYRQILELLEEMTAMYADATEDEAEEDDVEPMKEEDMIDAIVGEAVERGLDEELTERAFKNIAALVKKSAEG